MKGRADEQRSDVGAHQGLPASMPMRRLASEDGNGGTLLQRDWWKWKFGGRREDGHVSRWLSRCTGGRGRIAG